MSNKCRLDKYEVLESQLTVCKREELQMKEKLIACRKTCSLLQQELDELKKSIQEAPVETEQSDKKADEIIDALRKRTL